MFEQDIEQGLGITTVDEAIDHLIQSYKASDCYLEIKKQVADIHKQQVIRDMTYKFLNITLEIRIKINRCQIFYRKNHQVLH